MRIGVVRAVSSRTRTTMKLKNLLVASILAAAFPAAALAKDSLKLTYLQVGDLGDALASLDGATHLSAGTDASGAKVDNVPVKIAYELKGKVRLSIARDIKTLSDAHQVYVDAWKAYLKASSITDEKKETQDQQQKIADILNAPTELSLMLFDEADLVASDSDKNPIPPTTLTRLLPLIKPTKE